MKNSGILRKMDITMVSITVEKALARKPFAEGGNCFL
ncbi:hypothetical protein SAMN05444672_108145 [Bacillus sp. OK838]|nr:hypothetical protein SAMN05444672_108145 [Bacillus sp. OK838]